MKTDAAMLIMDARSAMRPCYILPMFFSSFFMPALVGQAAERIFTKLSHVDRYSTLECKQQIFGILLTISIKTN